MEASDLKLESVGKLVFTYSGTRDFFPTDELNKFIVDGYTILAKETAGGKCIDVTIFKRETGEKNERA